MELDEMILASEQQVAAEQSIVGCILLDEKCLTEVRAAIRPEMFAINRNKEAFVAACALQDKKTRIDPVTVGAKIREANGDTDWTNEYALQLMEAAVTPANVMAHCEVLRSEYTRWVMVQDLTVRQRDLLDGKNPKDVASDMMKFAEDLLSGDYRTGIVSASQAAVELMTSINDIMQGEKAPALKTGYDNLDRILGGGLQRNGFYVLAARPGCGKTTFALNVTYRVAKMGRRVLFVSLEMDREQLVARLIASEIGKINPTQILNATFDPEFEMDSIIDQSRHFAKMPIYFNKSESLNVSEIKYLAKLSKAELVVIDYLGLIENADTKGKLYEEVTKNSKALKLMARGLGIPILCLAQMNREFEKRGGEHKRPMLSDLRDSGSIEQDADAVIFHYIDENAKNGAFALPGTEYLDLIVAKNRHGETGIATMNWIKNTGKILEA